MAIRLVRLTGQDTPVWLEPALHIYVTAMDYPRGTEHHRASLWREHIARPGWSALAALAEPPADRLLTPDALRRRVGPPVSPTGDEVMVGIAYGYRGSDDQWWNQQLRTGLRQAGRSRAAIDDIATGYFELTELHVHPDAQGRGIGHELLTALLADRPENHVLLSTPEIPAERNRAWSLYRRMGFGDVLRNFTFSGDPRPFAFLGRRLPLTARQPVPERTWAPHPPPMAR
ncbi:MULTISPECIES: GNAT family N-acetyltransferase [unclassified Gordonia (in: high G+C Gram-positive bacteria)]